MTFVVAEAGARGVRIHADWLLSQPDGRADFGHPPVLKAVLLNGYQCVCWAGDVDESLSAVRALFADGIADAGDDDAVLALLHRAHMSGRPNAVQFLLVSLLGRRPAVHEISDGPPCRDMRLGWLGNQDAFRRYRRLRGILAQGADRATWDAMDRAFCQISLENEFPDVGGHYSMIVRTTESGDLGYAFSARAYPSLPASTSGHEYELLRSGDTASGGFSPSVMVPWRTGTPTVAVWIPEGRRGYVLDPRLRPRGVRLIEATNHEVFLSEIHSMTGCRLRGMVIEDGRARVVAA